jgi:gluconolactonase
MPSLRPSVDLRHLLLLLSLASCGASGSTPTPPATETAGSGGSPRGGNGGASGGKAGVIDEGTGGAGGAMAGGTGGAAGSDADPGSPMPADAQATETEMPVAASPICPPGPFEAPKVGPSEAICPGFDVKYNWNEGPTWVPQQHAFFFSNFVMRAPGPGDMIKYDPATNKCEIFIEGNGCNGLTPTADGGLIATCQTPRKVLKYDLTTKQSTVLVDMVEGKMLDSPNDVVIHHNGTIYFSNATFELAGRPMGLGSALMRIDPAGMVTVIAKGGINPLGISPDEKRLYAMGGYWDLDDAGVPQQKHAGFTLGSDGIAVDCAGNVYTQGGAIVSPANQTIGRFAAGTNMAFGGEDRKTLIVVGGKSMHIIKMNLPGLP